MPRSAAQILEEARQLPSGEQLWLVENLIGEQGAMSDESLAAWKKEVGEPEPEYDEWFRKGVEQALADNSGDAPHDEAMKHFHSSIRRARKLKQSA